MLYCIRCSLHTCITTWLHVRILYMYMYSMLRLCLVYMRLCILMHNVHEVVYSHVYVVRYVPVFMCLDRVYNVHTMYWGVSQTTCIVPTIIHVMQVDLVFLYTWSSCYLVPKVSNKLTIFVISAYHCRASVSKIKCSWVKYWCSKSTGVLVACQPACTQVSYETNCCTGLQGLYPIGIIPYIIITHTHVLVYL